MKQYFLFLGIIGIILLSFLSCKKKDNIDDSLDNLVTIASNLPKLTAYYDLMFINENVGYALSKSFVAKTTDGGYSWTTFEIPKHSYNGKIQFIDEQIGYVIGQNNRVLLKTTNGGQDWEEIDLNTYGYSPWGIYFLDKDTGFIVGEDLFIKTTDGGKSWANLKREDRITYLDVNFKNNKEGIVTFSNGEYFETTDGGTTWNNLKYNTVNSLYSIYFVENKTLVSTFHEKLLDITNNQEVISLPSSNLKFAFFDSKHSIATGTLITGCWTQSDNVFITNDGWETYTKKTLSGTEGTNPICAKMSESKIMVLTDRNVMIFER